jgi:uncharacterized protein YjeT (DUF2065 family)
MNHPAGIYVEVFIRGSVDEVWRRTQIPGLHQPWDLRFTTIEYLPRASDDQPQRFLYATRVGFGLQIRGEGESTGNRSTPDGIHASALRFWSKDPRSLIEEGSGYWRYIPQNDGVRFLTWYDYSVRFGAVGRIVDGLLFRPLIGWATAWSFDRLRRWIEEDLHPAAALHFSLIHAVARLAIAFVWIWQGLFPKLLFPSRDEITLMEAARVPADMLPIFGLAEILIGLAFLMMWNRRWMFVANILLMIAAIVPVVANSASYLFAAFNPVALNACMVALSIVGYLAAAFTPSARNCLRRPLEN